MYFKLAVFVTEPYFTNCPTRFVTVEIGEDGGVGSLPDLHLQAKDAFEHNLEVSWYHYEKKTIVTGGLRIYIHNF